MEENKKNIIGTISFAGAICGVLIATDYLIRAQFFQIGDTTFGTAMKHFINKTGDKMIIVRVLFLAVMCGLAILSARTKKDSEYKFPMWMHGITIAVCMLFVIGFIKGMYYWNLVAYPVLFFSSLILISKSLSQFKLGLQGEEDPLGKVSSKPDNDFSFFFDTDKGKLVIDSPQQGIYIESGAGGGKSASVIEPLIYQAIDKGYSAFIYDFKGNPPTLSKTAYSALLEKKYQPGEIPLKFAFLNFVDLTKTVRCNPISPNYIDTKLKAMNAAEVIMKNLEQSWVEKTDFWAANAISYLSAIIWRFAKEPKYHKYCTLPHVITACLSDLDSILGFLTEDRETSMVMKPLAEAYRMEASAQTAGAVSSTQLPTVKLYEPSIFYVLSPTMEEEFSLDISNKDKPIVFCLANDPIQKLSLSPAIALIGNMVMQQINQQGKRKCLFCIDELPTIYLGRELDNLPATARSNGVVTCLSVQIFAQLERDYTQKNAEIIIGNLGNQFFGMTNEQKTGTRVSDMLGTVKKKEISYSESDSGLSTSESLKSDKVMQAKEILGQKIGHFTGKIAGGEPPFFSVQLPYFNPKKTDIPSFSGLVKTGDEKMDRKVMDNLAKENFERINKEIEDLLAPYKKEIE